MTRMGTIMKRERLKKGLSQSQLGSALGFASGQFISNIERGLALPSDESLVALSRTLGVGVDYLMRAKLQDLKERMVEVVGNILKEGVL